MVALWTLLLWWLVALPAGAIDPDSPRRTPVVEAVAKATPAVVAIEVDVASRSPFLRFGNEARRGEGSGVIIDSEGVILTNAHVVDGAIAVRVRLADNREFEAQVVALDAPADLAVLRIKGASNLPVLPLGDSDDLLLGETVIAIGNPLGLGLTVSTGVVASTARDLPVGDGPVQTWIQTDAAINPGNSGGALIDLEGRLVGINTFIRRDAEGIGFAIPVSRAHKVAADLLTYGEVQLPWLGVTIADVPVGRRGHRGAHTAALVREVVAGGPASQAGLSKGDVLLSVGHHRVTSRADVNARLAERAPGDTVMIEVQRADGTRVVPVATGRAPGELSSAQVEALLGVRFEPSKGGLVAVQVRRDGVWVREGLATGDVLVAIDGRPLSDLSALRVAISRAVAHHRPALWATVARGRYLGTLELKLYTSGKLLGSPRVVTPRSQGLQRR